MANMLENFIMVREFEHFLCSRVYRVQNQHAYGRLPMGLIAKCYTSVLHQLIVIGAHVQFKPAFSGIFALVRLVIFTTAELAVIFDG